ncbi:MAG: LamG domain-containing protein, partial [Akkermansiaceae bacterium]|nr:LamG domain-containing protein [Verrucomicrobiales bacterium]
MKSSNRPPIQKSFLTLLFGLLILPAVLAADKAAAKNSPPCAPPPSGLVSWWRGEGNATDAGGGNSGSLQNGATFAPGMAGQAFSFDGVKGSVNMPHAANLGVGKQVTIEFWMKSGPGNLMNTCCQGLVTSEFYLIEISSGSQSRVGINFIISTDNGASYAQISEANGGGAVVSPEQWHHIAGTYDGSRLQLYVDGQAWGNPMAHTGNISAMSPGGFVAIGSEDGRVNDRTCVGTRYFKGLIDEPAIYNRALSAAEIQSIYNAGSAGKCREPVSTVTLTDFKLIGNLTGDRAAFTLMATANVENPKGGSLELLSGTLALTEVGPHPKWELRAEQGRYIAVFERGGKFPITLKFNAAVKQNAGWNVVDFRVAQSALQPVVLEGLAADTLFEFAGAARTERTGSNFVSH